MPKTRSAEPTDVSRAWGDASECFRACKQKPSTGNIEALLHAVTSYQRAVLVDMLGEPPEQAPAPGPKLKSVS